ncbi:IS5 family transposase [Microvirga sp. BSC39]|uniref:IS5 family transposase n=1 Tax=Microvirga sp. BSC39 TaxID=1549810 RepID=UPI0012699D7E|nr:IS5 family transposase [Microvirga sp. BSC39]
MALRQTEELIGSILRLLGLDLAVPDHSTLSRRAERLEVPRSVPSTGPAHLLVDSTGLRLCGSGEWMVEKHGTHRRRSWRKLHIGVDASTGQILASELTPHDVDDGSQVEPLLDQITDPLASLIGDGAYDQIGVYDIVAERFIQTLLREWAYAIPFNSSDTRGTDLPRWLTWYNQQRPHGSLGRRTPAQALAGIT